MNTHSLDLRERVVAAADEGVLSQRGVAELFAVSYSWLQKAALHQREERGSLAPGAAWRRPEAASGRGDP